jgi:hypothetical protein
MVMVARDIVLAGGVTNTYQGVMTYRAKKKARDALTGIASSRGADHSVPRAHSLVHTAVASAFSKTWGRNGTNPANSWTDEGYFGWFTGFESMSFWGAGSEKTACYNRALSKLNDDVRGSTDISIDLFQMRQTKDVGKSCRSIWQELLKADGAVAAATRPLKRKIKLAETAFKGVLAAGSQARLLWVYGIKPSMETIYDVAKNEYNHYVRRGQWFKGRAGDSVSYKNITHASSWPDSNFNCDYTSKGFYRTRLAVNLAIPDNGNTQLARLTSLNPASIAWELLPFSFVIDWFINIGGFIRDLETNLLYRRYFRYGYRTDTSKEMVWYRARNNIQPYAGGTVMTRMIITRKTRTILSSYPFPARPDINADLGSSRLFNLAALFGAYVTMKGGKPSNKGMKSEFSF